MEAGLIFVAGGTLVALFIPALVSITAALTHWYGQYYWPTKRASPVVSIAEILAAKRAWQKTVALINIEYHERYCTQAQNRYNTLGARPENLTPSRKVDQYDCHGVLVYRGYPSPVANFIASEVNYQNHEGESYPEMCRRMVHRIGGFRFVCVAPLPDNY